MTKPLSLPLSVLPLGFPLSIGIHLIFYLKLVINYNIVFGSDKPVQFDLCQGTGKYKDSFLSPLISMGAFPVLVNKFTEKTIVELTVSAAVYRTSCTKALEYGATGFVEITFPIPVIFPDAAYFFSSLVRHRRIYKDRNYPHLYRVLNRDFYRIYPKKQFLKQILKHFSHLEQGELLPYV
jgi:hypothetical protein